MSHLLPIPPIQTATDPVWSPEDLRQRWRALMGPLGFGQRLLWFGLVGPDRRFVRQLGQVPIGSRPRGRVVRNLMAALRTLLDEHEPRTTVALLLSAPGRGPVSSIDLIWAKSLADMAQRLAVPLEPIFRASDESIELCPTTGSGRPASPG